jgi:nitrogen fixation/metabolism regulation signal transduction histidine kinase
MLVDIELDSLNRDVFKKHLNAISEQVQYLSKTIDDFKNFLKPNVIREEIYIAEVINIAMNLIKNSFKNNNIEIKINISNNYPIKVVKNEMIQVLLNLFQNSRDSIFERKIVNPQIYIDAKIKNAKKILSIYDNAGGIKDDILDRIFEPYFSTKNEKNSTGLGLYMSKMILEKHINANIFVTNIQDGAKFEIIFDTE